MATPTRFICHLLVASAGAALVAQSSTTSALVGEVKNSAGKPLAGVKLSLSSEALMGTRSVITSANGSFRVPVLPPGKYRVSAEAEGYTPQVRGVVLTLSNTIGLNFTLAETAGATVVVMDAATSLSAAPLGTSPTFNAETLESLPVKRDLTSVMNLTPGINGGVAWGGDRGNSNAYLIDGINVGDALYGSQYVYVNPDWFSEIQVGGLGASAEYGGFNGGYINSLVKRGGNDLNGSVNGYYSPDAWRARPKLKDSRLKDTTIPTTDWDMNVNVGGPIVKDRLWYFVSAEKQFNSNAPVGAVAPVETLNPKYLGKLTWQVAASTTLDMFMAYDGLSREHRGITNQMEAVAAIQQKGTDRTYGMTMTQLMGSSAVLTVKASGYSGSYSLGEYQPGLASVGLGSGSFNGLTRFRNTSWHDAYLSARGTLSAVLDFYATGVFSANDSHAFRIGLEGEQARAEQVSYRVGGLTYDGTGVAATPTTPARVTTYRVNKGGDINIRGNIDRTVLFVLDTWTQGRWRIQPGLRFETFKGRGYGTSNIWSTSVVAPRLGVTLDLKGDQRFLLKAHLGRYFDGLTVVHFDRTIPGAYSRTTTHAWGAAPGYGATTFDLNNPEAIPYNPIPLSTGTDTNTSRLDPNVKHPHTDEALLALDTKVGDNWSLGVSGVYRKNKNLLGRNDERLTYNTLPGNTVYDNFTGQTLQVYGITNVTTPGQDFVIRNQPGFHRTYTALSFSFERKLASNWATSGSYTRALRKGNTNRSNGYDDAFANPNYQTNFDGKLPGFNEDELKLRGMFVAPWKTTISVSYTYLSGERFTRTLSAPAPASPAANANYTIWAESLGSSKYPGRHLVDMHLAHKVKFTAFSVEGFADIYNILNMGDALSYGSNTRSNSSRALTAASANAAVVSATYLQATAQEEARNVRLGVRFRF